jgi:hypothetical protein
MGVAIFGEKQIVGTVDVVLAVEPSMSDSPQLTPTELHEWKQSLEEANRYNIFCHCRECKREWVASKPEACICGSNHVERIACWQFPDG